MNRPSGAHLEELARLAKQGSLTEIEQWIGKFSNDASYSTFVTELQERLSQLDFLGIVDLATVPEPRTNSQ